MIAAMQSARVRLTILPVHVLRTGVLGQPARFAAGAAWGWSAGEAGGVDVDAAYERRSIALTSNIHPAAFDELMPKTLAAATVERLLHHARVVLTDGSESYRLARQRPAKD